MGTERTTASTWLLAAMLVLVLAATGLPSYLGSDDIGIVRWLEFGFEAPFISMLMAKFLAFLYRDVSPSFPWYGVVLMGGHALSLGLFLSAAATTLRGARAVTRRVFVLLYIVVYLGFVLRVSYNSASVLLGANACLYYWARTTARGRTTIPDALFAGILLALSYLVRVDGSYLAFALGLPLLALTLWPRGGEARGRDRLGRLALFGTPAALCVLLHMTVVPALVSPEYKEFASFNHARGRFMDHPLIAANANNLELLALNNWTTNDYLAVSSWMFLDEDTFGKEKFLNALNRPDIVAPAPRHHAVRTALRFLQHYAEFVLLLALAVFAAWRHSTPERRWSFWYALYALGFMGALAVLYQFPSRVGRPAFLFAAGTTYLLSARGPPRTVVGRRGERVLRWVLPVAAVVIAVYWGGQFVTHARLIRTRRAAFGDVMAALRKYPEQTLFVVEPTSGIRWDCISPLTTRNRYPQNILPSGWSIFSPLFYRVLRDSGIARGADVFPAALDGTNVYFVVRGERFLSMLGVFARDHLGVEAELEVVDRLPGDRSVYRLVTRTWPQE